jgi:hypothetical protein
MSGSVVHDRVYDGKMFIPHTVEGDLIMSIDREITVTTHPNIYTNYSPRNMNVYISEPSQGINEQTGFCLFVAGYGGNANSNVYKKMRSIFADKYNLVTVQCDYFGHEFMQGSESVIFDLDIDYFAKFLSTDELLHVFEGNMFHLERFIAVSQKYRMTVSANESLNESLDNFNDMGIMQALDNLRALLYVMNQVRAQGVSFNSKKIIVYGHSHGAYLSYLCNAFAPHLISLLIDNSAWLFPNYLMTTRFFSKEFGLMNLNVKFNYLASKLPYDFNLLCLPILYQTFNNSCKILSFQGSSDNLVLPRQKRSFCNIVPNCTYVEIGEEQVDGFIFKSTAHGLDADFLNLFNYVMDGQKFDLGTEVKLPTVHIETEQKIYKITYENGFPLFVSHLKE